MNLQHSATVSTRAEHRPQRLTTLGARYGSAGASLRRPSASSALPSCDSAAFASALAEMPRCSGRSLDGQPLGSSPHQQKPAALATACSVRGAQGCRRSCSLALRAAARERRRATAPRRRQAPGQVPGEAARQIASETQKAVVEETADARRSPPAPVSRRSSSPSWPTRTTCSTTAAAGAKSVVRRDG